MNLGILYNYVDVWDGVGSRFHADYCMQIWIIKRITYHRDYRALKNFGISIVCPDLILYLQEKTYTASTTAGLTLVIMTSSADKSTGLSFEVAQVGAAGAFTETSCAEG